MINMKKIVWTLIGIAILSIGSHFYFKIANTRLNFSYLDKFQYIPYINCYDKGEPRIYFGQQKAKRAVLLLHGFGASPSAFDHLIEKLNQEQIPYYAPLITGFGIGDFHLLNVATETDWARDAFFGFDLLTSFAEKVDVIGHSNGGCLAVLLASHRPVDRLILLDPYLFSQLPSLIDKIFKSIIETPIIGNIFCFIYSVPNLGKMDVENKKAASSALEFQAVPTHSLAALWKTQNFADQNEMAIKKWAVSGGSGTHKTVFILYGQEDTTADMPDVLSYFKRNDILIQSKGYPHTAHDLLIDYDWRPIVSDILTVLNENKL
jgi:esterase/lipase